MSWRKVNSGYQNEEQSEDQGRCSRFENEDAIACVECGMVFFDKVSLVLHYGCHHLPGKISILGQHSGNLASFQSGGALSLRLSPYSSPSLERTNEAASPRVNNCFRFSPLPIYTNFVLNSMPPMKSSFDALLNVPQPIHCSVMSGTSFYGSTSSSTRPVMCSQLGPKTSAYGPTPAPHLRLPEQRAGRARFRNSRIPHNNQPEEPVLIVLSDSDEEAAVGENSAEEIDLTLKL